MRRRAAEAIRRRRAAACSTRPVTPDTRVGGGVGAARARVAVLDGGTVARAAVEREPIAIVAHFAAHAQPVAADLRTRAQRREGAARARKTRLHHTGRAAAVAADCAVVVTALSQGAPGDAPPVAADRRTRVDAADARADRDRRDAREALLDATERVAAVSAGRIIVIARFRRRANAVTADVHHRHHGHRLLVGARAVGGRLVGDGRDRRKQGIFGLVARVEGRLSLARRHHAEEVRDG